jgi:hypothetical protein
VKLAIDWFQQFILMSYHQDCLARVAHSLRGVLLWNRELGSLRVKTRSVFNRAKITGD